MNDGQGQQYGSSGIPLDAGSSSAPAGSDASACAALAAPGQTTAVARPIDLGNIHPPVLAPTFQPDGTTCDGSNFGLLLALGVGLLILVWR